MVNLVHIYSQAFTSIFSDCVKSVSFPVILKGVDNRPAFKKVDKTDKINYRPIGTLSDFLKVFEKLIYVQIN